MTVESAVAFAGDCAPRAQRPRDADPHRCVVGAGAFRRATRHPPQPRRYRARRRALVLIMPLVDGQPLRILHATRAPVGGIFRHILDLANGQADRGHHVGIIADSLTGGERAEQALAEIAPRLKLGVHRTAIRREPLPSDFLVWARFQRMIRQLKPDVLHGHVAKAGAYMRLRTASRDSIRVYTPHRGSLHYPLATLKGNIYARGERALMHDTDPVLFESALAAHT